MESTFQGPDQGACSLKESWQHCKALFSASSPSAAWQSFKSTIDALPLWALIVLVVIATALVVDSSFLLTPLAAGLFLLAIYVTVKRAVIAGMK